MNTNFELYKVFYEVAKQGNITRASYELCISQPGVSKAIKNLEDQLDTTLFIRSKRGVTLTEEGKTLFVEIKKVMEIIETAENKIKMTEELEYGYLRIGVSKTITQNYLLPFIAQFHEMYPNIRIKIFTDPTKELLKKVNEGIIDLMIINMPFATPVNYEVINLIEIHDCFVANEKYKELKNKVVNLKDLNEYPLIFAANGSNTRYYLDNFCINNDIYLNPDIELASNSLVTDFALYGFGIGVATKEYIKNELDNGSLFEIKTKPTLPSRSIALVYSKDIKLSKASSEFIDLISNTKKD